jgi:acyl-CoA thioester hydrolase
MQHRFVTREMVQFSDTDMAGIMHFANYARFMERAEHAFFRSLGLSIFENPALIPDGERVGWPRVHFSCDFHAPLRFEDEVEVELLVEEIRSKAVRYLFRIWRPDGELAAEGRMASACVRKDLETCKMKAVEIPARIRDKMQAAPPEMLKRPAKK